FSGTPELQLDYFPLKSWGVTSSFGHTYKTKRGGWIAVGDNAEIHDLTGNFFKAGLKYRTPSRRGSSFLGFGQLSYVFSKFNETGKRSTSLANAEVVNFKGFVNGVALAFGLEFRLVSIVHFRAGIQFGIYGPRKHLGYP